MRKRRVFVLVLVALLTGVLLGLGIALAIVYAVGICEPVFFVPSLYL